MTKMQSEDDRKYSCTHNMTHEFAAIYCATYKNMTISVFQQQTLCHSPDTNSRNDWLIRCSALKANHTKRTFTGNSYEYHKGSLALGIQLILKS